MYLKSIEVQGFKSFANKITFQFHNGITGIVGPNGSGKSNVADAVRWVLGEQRIKQLRGASMQDVIFSGTETRKPLGYAYVAITLDNEDHQLPIEYDEVTVSRRIYRSGESEYKINGSTCRLKDVSELFYDTGIGKEGYSIIGQGQIDKILSGKPEERRELFDEAAGIVKFKRRKATAQKKLEDEKQNLVRVSDILSELEKQVEPLSRQAEKARVFLRRREELKKLDVNVFLLENERLRGQLDKVGESYEIARADLDETTRQYEGIREEYDRVQERLEELETAIEGARETLASSSVLRGKLEGEINVLREQIHSAGGSEAHFRERMESVRREIGLRESERADLLEQKQAVDEQVREAVKGREEARERLTGLQERIEQLNGRIEQEKNAIIEALNQRGAIRSRLERCDTMMEQAGIRKAELNSRLLRARSDEETQQETIRKLEEDFAQIQAEIQSLNEQQQVLEERGGEVRDRLANRDQKLRDTQVLYHQEKSRLEALSNLTERYEGYGGSVKRVMEKKETEKGMIGVVADIIQTDKKYETAIETALGGNIQNIVTDNEETAKRMIAFLKKERAGRATFLPLTSLKNAQPFRNPEALSEPGVLGLADELVRTEPAYRDVAKTLLGRILVVDNVDHAVSIARKFRYSIRMVTLEGELLVPGGAISGGAFRSSSNLLGRRREMEELETKVKTTLLQIDALLEEIEQIKQERQQLRMKLEEVKSRIQDRFLAQNTARMNVMQAQERRSEAEAGLDELKVEQQEIERQMQEITLQKEAAQGELEDSRQAEQKAGEEIARFQSELEEKRAGESAQTAQLAELDVEVEKMRQTQGFHQQNVDRIDGELALRGGELEELEAQLKKTAQEMEEKRRQIEEIEKTVAASHTTQSDTQKKLQEDMEAREALTAQQKGFFERREEMSGRMTALDKEVYRLNAQKERLEESVESQINYMWDEYEITLTDAAGMRDGELTDLPEMKRQIAALKDEIKKLGDVNVGAIEDYRSLMERYEFLKGQHNDLVEAEQTLLGIIDELDTAMRRQFTEKFAEIGREFDKVFRELFGGGKGTLELLEDEDILEAGIRIVAQPPGKKLQNMMQLSGGEKALTAIALLFAIQNLKPSPFCLLDEIEAALDESNVSRFAAYLHKLTRHTQFIVITHRRGTMEQADRLYGITMQEKGISTLVSVNLIENDLEPYAEEKQA